MARFLGARAKPWRLLHQYFEVQQARRRIVAPRRLPFLIVEITQACNAGCATCGYPTDYPASGPQMTTDELCSVIDEAHDLGTLLISLGGGEPFLRPDVERLIARIAGHGIGALVHTNGSLLTPRRWRRLAETSGLVMSFSLDSSLRDEHDRFRGVACFDRVVAASEHFARERTAAKAAWIFTIRSDNVQQMLPVMQLARDVGVRTVRFTPVHDNLQHRYKARESFAPFRLGAAQLDVLQEQIAEVLSFAGRHGMVTNSSQFLSDIPQALAGRVPHRCYAGFAFCVLDPYGNLLPCYDHPPGVSLREAGGLAAALRAPAMDVLRRRVDACRQPCWNIGTAEPSLRLDPARLPAHFGQLTREALFFLS